MSQNSHRVPSFWAGSAVIVSASFAMAATLPARTHGMGLITTRLLEDFASLDETGFARINFVATLLGSLACLPCGWCLDRFGVRPVMAFAMLGLAATVFAMTKTTDVMVLALAITLTRCFGQSMLSVVSISMVGKWFERSSGAAMGSYAVLMTMMMAVGTGVLGSRVTAVGWRIAWSEVALGLILLTPVALVLALKRRKGHCGEVLEEVTNQLTNETTNAVPGSVPFSKAIRTGCFWVFSLSISLFGLVSSGVTLFQQLILEERGLGESVFHSVLVIGLVAGLVANLLGGWLSRTRSMSRMLAFAMLLLAISLVSLTWLRTPMHAYIQAIVAGLAGGLITVLFFSVWVHAFGSQNLGQIQGVAQMMTVLASATGPLVVSTGRNYSGSYFPVLYSLALVSAILAGGAWFVKVRKN